MEMKTVKTEVVSYTLELSELERRLIRNIFIKIRPHVDFHDRQVQTMYDEVITKLEVPEMPRSHGMKAD